MSDWDDAERDSVWGTTEGVYLVIRVASNRLPIPIALPGKDATVQDRVDAVRRAFDLADDQPLPEEQQARYALGCLHWLVAVDLLILSEGDGFHDTRIMGAQANLLLAQDQLLDLGRWFRAQE